jgi:pyrimidine-nucleoside phosphorylase
MGQRMIDLIETKRDGGELTSEQIEWFVTAFTADEVPDYQAAALLMAIFWRGMSRRETVDLTRAMARSGDQLDLHDVVPFTVDKHSSGGVGDKTTLVVQPIVAACGLPVGKMSGRGLGSSGGTLDKMESFSGWTASLSLEQYKRQLAEIGLVLCGQTADLAPADGKLYALRDVTGTVANTSLIAASIMSKKLAGGADAIVLDVKMGNGAFMPTVVAARELAQVMVNIGNDAGRKTVALISDMNQPLGEAVGNALEVKEAIATLQGDGPSDFWAHCLEVAAHMLVVGQKAGSLAEASEMAKAARADGRALAKFRQLVWAQGGDSRQVDEPDRLPQAPLVEPVNAPRDGFIGGLNTRAIGWCSVRLGAGRLVKSEAIDYGVGLVIPAKVGSKAEAGQPLAWIHAARVEQIEAARQEILGAIEWADEPVGALPHSYGTVGDL